MITCPVCERENSENSQNCKECGFTLKYARDGYHINISDEEAERYRKELEEARKKYKRKQSDGDKRKANEENKKTNNKKYKNIKITPKNDDTQKKQNPIRNNQKKETKIEEKGNFSYQGNIIIGSCGNSSNSKKAKIFRDFESDLLKFYLEYEKRYYDKKKPVKGEFEKSSEYKERLKRYEEDKREWSIQHSLNRKNFILNELNKKSLIKMFGDAKLMLEKYDADREFFPAKVCFSGGLTLKVKIKINRDIAKKFKYDTKSHIFKLHLQISNKVMTIKSFYIVFESIPLDCELLEEEKIKIFSKESIAYMIFNSDFKSLKEVENILSQRVLDLKRKRGAIIKKILQINIFFIVIYLIGITPIYIPLIIVFFSFLYFNYEKEDIFSEIEKIEEYMVKLNPKFKKSQDVKSNSKPKTQAKPKPSQRFIRDDKKGVVIDNKTNLMWQDDYSDNGGKIKRANWKDAHTYCKNLRLGGYSDWRLPTIDELRSIVDKSRTNPAIDTSIFTKTNKTKLDFYWSSTTNVYYRDNVWIVGFCYGFDKGGYKDYSHSVRCVRDNKS